MKRILILAALLVGCGSPHTSMVQEKFDDGAWEAADFEWQVGLVGSIQYLGVNICTGFATGEFEIRTAAHCVQQAHDLYQYATGRDNFLISSIEIDKDHDLAILKTEKPLARWYDIAPYQRGSISLVSSAPGGGVRTDDSRSELYHGYLKHWADSVPTASGSPVIQKGKVVAVHIGYAKDLFNLAVPIVGASQLSSISQLEDIIIQECDGSNCTPRDPPNQTPKDPPLGPGGPIVPSPPSQDPDPQFPSEGNNDDDNNEPGSSSSGGSEVPVETEESFQVGKALLGDADDGYYNDALNNVCRSLLGSSGAKKEEAYNRLKGLLLADANPRANSAEEAERNARVDIQIVHPRQNSTVNINGKLGANRTGPSAEAGFNFNVNTTESEVIINVVRSYDLGEGSRVLCSEGESYIVEIMLAYPSGNTIRATEVSRAYREILGRLPTKSELLRDLGQSKNINQVRGRLHGMISPAL